MQHQSNRAVSEAICELLKAIDNATHDQLAEHLRYTIEQEGETDNSAIVNYWKRERDGLLAFIGASDHSYDRRFNQWRAEYFNRASGRWSLLDTFATWDDAQARCEQETCTTRVMKDQLRAVTA